MPLVPMARRRTHSPHHYRFRDAWTLPAPPDTVYTVLEAVADYPSWWPQVRRVHQADDISGTVHIRSLLPYGLTLTARQSRRDPHARVLEVVVHGDLEGWARWTVLPHGTTGSIARFEQDVDATKPLMRHLAVPARPLFRANHAWMMRCGRRGLRALLESRPQGRPEAGPEGI
ncbi:SRPBCC family protein [Streptomyces sp. C36]|uniref:SRPBCC family protein n=1 Tax=Streptomyces sp. C36 TaxID=3237122 RepID=UPI0034C5F2FB